MCILLGQENENFIKITILGRSYPEADGHADGNWLGAQVDFSIGSFEGGTKPSLRSNEIERFYKEVLALYESLKGEAQYRSIEEWLEICLIGNGRGGVNASGYISDGPDFENKLYFKINLDQTYLKGLMNGLKETLQKFPVLG